MTSPPPKRARTTPEYSLLYHPGIPGRGEYIRLVLEATGTAYTDIARDEPDGYSIVQAAMSPTSEGDDDGNPPVFAPPALRISGEGNDGKALVISQTPNVLRFLGGRLGLRGEGEAEGWHVDGLALTALDLCNEAHDTHHPVATVLYYEDQKEEALRKAADFRENRIPKFFGYFERVLKGNKESGKGRYLVGGKLSYADTTLWQVVDGIHFAFPKELEAQTKSGEYPLLLESFYPAIKEEQGIKQYLASERRQKYSMGIFRHYPELDRQ